MEILAPVKNYQSARVAVQNGADELYLSSPSFGARSNASLTIDEIILIVDYANQYQVKTFIAFNTVIFEDELPEFFKEVNLVYNAGATGVILQDFALVKLISDKYPDFEVHSSTQMNINNSNATKLLQSLGSNRVVVPREMSFKRIRTIKDQTGVDIEAFIHGALCVSYSGQCYDSTLLDQKSANRGRCSQYCRMPQVIVNKRNEEIISTSNYPLNLKDMCNINNVDKYLKAGVNSLKIEGRLKQLDYTGNTVKHYKEQLINVKHNKHVEVDVNELKKTYNREFTTGRIDGINGRDLVNLKKPNNTGIKVGHVVDVYQNDNIHLKFYKYCVVISATDVISLHDNIRFINDEFEDGQVVEQIKDDNGDYIIYSNCVVNVGDDVFKTHDYNLFQMHKQVAEKFGRRMIVDVDLSLVNGVICYQIDQFGIYVETMIMMQTPLKQAVSKEVIFDKLSKTNDTPFSLNLSFSGYNDNLYLGFSEIKKIKQMIINSLKECLMVKHDVSPLLYEGVEVVKHDDSCENTYYVEVRSLEQYQIAKQFDNVVVMIGDLALIEEIEFDVADFVVMPKVLYDDELAEVLSQIKDYKNVCVSELGGLMYFTNKNIITNFTLNTTNLLNQQMLLEQGASLTTLSIELNHQMLKSMANDASIVNIYGRVPVMAMDYCPINLDKTDTCGSCKRCHRGTYVLRDEYKREFPLLYEGNYRISMYSKEPISLISKINELNEFGINKFNIRLTDENAEQTKTVIHALTKPGVKLNYKTSLGSYFKEIL